MSAIVQGTRVLPSAAESADRSRPAAERVDFAALASLMLPLAALWVLVDHFAIESAAFADLALLAFGGFGIHYFLPLRYRLPFFLCLSVAGLFVVIGAGPAMWLLSLGLGLIALCHLPASWRVKIGLLVLAGVTLAALRVEWVPSTIPAPVWPIVGSMFMFRMVVYVYDLRHDPQLGSVWTSLSYFFLLPNVCFPLFPVVDYKSFTRLYYNDERHRIHEEGVRWIYRGVLQLLLYRIVYRTVVLDPLEVSNAAELVQYLIWPFLLYLRVSGQFHIIIGMLRLFGFNLPETHHSYFLASSFTDFWRRINIYWKDFMMKVFYYPVFFSLRKRGQVLALVAATVLVFVLTWLLHAYQWFWLRGSFMFTWNDGLFWAILGLLVVVNALREWARPQPVSKGVLAWGPALMLAVRTTAMFCAIAILWSLWSTESIETWISLWSAAREWPDHVSWATMACLLAPVAVFGTVVVKARGWAPARFDTMPARSLVMVATCACLVVASSWRASAYFGPAGSALLSLRNSGLNQADAVALERGYYENLMAFDRFNGELWALYMNRPLDWGRGLIEEGLAEPAGPRLPYELRPSVAGPFKGAVLETNRWGMHDKEYEKVPPPGCERIALLGASHAMGSGVPREKTFEALVEERLNRERGRCYEILNFAVYGYSPLVQLEVIEKRVLEFQPGTILYVAHPEDSMRVTRLLGQYVTAGVELPDPELGTLVARAGVTKDMALRQVRQQLAPSGMDVLSVVYRRMVAIAVSHGMCAGLAYMPMVPDMTYAVDLSREKQVGADAGFAVLDLFGAYSVPDRNALWIAEWDAHPNAQGHALIADKLYARILENEKELFGCRAPRTVSRGVASPD
jgi:D-alanyl-lipoteichoic acid acyltransferase DltB (MBOAT superfamily)